MVLIPGGRFMMGDEDEVDATPHEVVVSSFYMDKYLVTQEQYQRVMGENPSRWKAGQIPWSRCVGPMLQDTAMPVLAWKGFSLAMI